MATVQVKAADNVPLELNPSAIQISSNESSQVALVVRNDGAAAIAGLQLDWSRDTGITVHTRALPASIPVQSAIVLPASDNCARDADSED
jgi:hypothetical protein